MRVWTFAEAAQAILNDDKEAIQELGAKYPLFTTAIARIVDNQAVRGILSCIPDYVTARKMEAYMKGNLSNFNFAPDLPLDDGEEVEKELKAQKTVEKRKATRAANKAKKEAEEKTKEEEKEILPPPVEPENDYSSMNVLSLYKRCKKRGIEIEPRLGRAEYIRALEELDEKQAEEMEETEGTDGEWEEEEKPKTKKPQKEKKPVLEDEEEWDFD